jgi:hypothetical protein
MRGFSPDVATTAENTHHYAGQLIAAYYLWGWVANLGSVVREYLQGLDVVTPYPRVCIVRYNIVYYPDSRDIKMGEVATVHGRGLAKGTITPWELADRIRQDLSP